MIQIHRVCKRLLAVVTVIAVAWIGVALAGAGPIGDPSAPVPPALANPEAPSPDSGAGPAGIPEAPAGDTAGSPPGAQTGGLPIESGNPPAPAPGGDPNPSDPDAPSVPPPGGDPSGPVDGNPPDSPLESTGPAPMEPDPSGAPAGSIDGQPGGVPDPTAEADPGLPADATPGALPDETWEPAETIRPKSSGTPEPQGVEANGTNTPETSSLPIQTPGPDDAPEAGLGSVPSESPAPLPSPDASAEVELLMVETLDLMLLDEPLQAPPEFYMGFTQPSDITVKNGATLGIIQARLPGQVQCLTSDILNPMANVAWNLSGLSGYDPAKKTQQDFSVTGSIALPSGYVNEHSYPQSVTLQVTISAGGAQAPVITTTSLPNGEVGVAYPSTQIQATGAAITYSATGLPPGLSVNASGVLSGTPTAAGTYSVELIAENTDGYGTKTLSVTIEATAPVITTTDLPDGVKGTIYGPFQITATGKGNITFSAKELPVGMKVTSSGSLKGSTNEDGQFRVEITATNAYGSDVKTLTLTIAGSAPTILTTALPDGEVGTAYPRFDIDTAGGGTITYSATGLPAGLTLSATRGSLYGTPTQAGDFQVEITAENAAGKHTVTLPLRVVNPLLPVILPDALPNGLVGLPYGPVQITAEGEGEITITFSMIALPAGLSLSPEGVLSGTPQSANVNCYFKVTATNAHGSVEKNLSFVVNAPDSSIVTETLPGGTAGIPYSAKIETKITDPSTVSLAATGLPAGLTLSPQGEISGTPTQAGEYPVTVTLTIGSTLYDFRSYTLSIAAPAADPSGGKNETQPGKSDDVNKTTLPLYVELVPAGSQSDYTIYSVGGILYIDVATDLWEGDETSASLPMGLRLYADAARTQRLPADGETLTLGTLSAHFSSLSGASAPWLSGGATMVPRGGDAPVTLHIPTMSADSATGSFFIQAESETANYETAAVSVQLRRVARDQIASMVIVERYVTLAVGESVQLSVRPDAAESYPNLQLSELNAANYVHIDGLKITGLAVGTSQIQASSSGKVADQITVNVVATKDESSGTVATTQTWRVVARTTNVRSGPGTSYDKTGTVTMNAVVSGEDTGTGWVKIGEDQYVNRQYLVPVSTSTADTTTYTVTATSLNLRSGPGSSYEKTGSLTRNSVVEVVAIQNGWAQLTTGEWVSIQHLKEAQ